MRFSKKSSSREIDVCIFCEFSRSKKVDYIRYVDNNDISFDIYSIVDMS